MAAAVCSQLGFNGSAHALPGHLFGNSTLPPVAEALGCPPGAGNLSACIVKTVKEKGCGYKSSPLAMACNGAEWVGARVQLWAGHLSSALASCVVSSLPPSPPPPCRCCRHAGAVCGAPGRQLHCQVSPPRGAAGARRCVGRLVQHLPGRRAGPGGVSTAGPEGWSREAGFWAGAQWPWRPAAGGRIGVHRGGLSGRLPTQGSGVASCLLGAEIACESE